MNQGPTVVLAAFDDIDFVAAFRTVESAWSMLGSEHQISAGLPVHPLRVAMTVGPDFGTCVLLSDERIVRRNRAVVVQPQRFGGGRIETLGQFTLGRVAGRDVELAVWTKANTTTRVILRGRN